MSNPQQGDDGKNAPVPPVAGRASQASLAERLARGRAAAMSAREGAAPDSGATFDGPPPPPPPPPANRIDARAEAYPPISGRPDARIAPRSPRTALEPERIPAPTRRSRRVRHPLVIFGNAVFTIILLLSLIHI